jgi:hypothetical protein
MASDPNAALTGAAFDLANAGYKAMPDHIKKEEQEEIGGDGASLREAAAQRARPHDNLVVREYLDAKGKPVAADEAISLDRAGRDYASAIAADKSALDGESSAELAARVDALRAEALAKDSDAGEFYGFEPPDAASHKKSGQSEQGTAANDRQGSGAETEGLDPVLEKVLQHPQVRQAIEQQIAEAENIRQHYLNGIAAATQIAQTSFLSQFPELAGIATENLPGALALMARQDPAKFARVQAMIASTEQLFAQQRQEGNRQAEIARQNFRGYAKSEDARFETMMKGEAPETQHAVMNEIMASAKASGIGEAELARLFNSEPLMRNAVFQRMMYDAGKYRLMMKTKAAVSAKPMPPVQRPGMARTAAERDNADMRTLSARLSNSGDIKDAVALYHARKSGRR